MEGNSVSRPFAGFSLLHHAVTLLSWLPFARSRPDVTRPRVTASKVRVDSFHVNNVKICIDARAYAAEKLARIMARCIGIASMIRELARDFRNDFRLAVASR